MEQWIKKKIKLKDFAWCEPWREQYWTCTISCNMLNYNRVSSWKINKIVIAFGRICATICEGNNIELELLLEVVPIGNSILYCSIQFSSCFIWLNVLPNMHLFLLCRAAIIFIKASDHTKSILFFMTCIMKILHWDSQFSSLCCLLLKFLL